MKFTIEAAEKTKKESKESAEDGYKFKVHNTTKDGSFCGGAPALNSPANRNLKNILDSLAATTQKGGRLRHPTFQRIFGRAEVSPWGWTFAGTPLYAISRSNWSPDSAKLRPLLEAPR